MLHLFSNLVFALLFDALHWKNIILLHVLAFFSVNVTFHWSRHSLSLPIILLSNLSRNFMQGGGCKVVLSFEGNFPNRIKQLPLDKHFDIKNVKRVFNLWTSSFQISLLALWFDMRAVKSKFLLYLCVNSNWNHPMMQNSMLIPVFSNHYDPKQSVICTVIFKMQYRYDIVHLCLQCCLWIWNQPLIAKFGINIMKSVTKLHSAATAFIFVRPVFLTLISLFSWSTLCFFSHLIQVCCLWSGSRFWLGRLVSVSGNPYLVEVLVLDGVWNFQCLWFCTPYYQKKNNFCYLMLYLLFIISPFSRLCWKQMVISHTWYPLKKGWDPW